MKTRIGALILLPGILCVTPLAHADDVIATGPSSAVDGYLDVGLDEYGAWASAGFGGTGDHFNPAGAFTSQEAAFTSGLFLFAGGNQRELLTSNATWQGVVSLDTSLARSITAGNVASDTNSDGVDDTLTSAFQVTGGGTNLGFGVTQHVSAFGAAQAFLQQDFVITNNGTGPISFNLVAAFDGDLLWSGGFENDQVGTSMHGAGLGTYAFEEEASDPGVTAVTLSSLQGNQYFGGKHGVDPLGAGLPFNYGTDTQVWDAFGIPANWANFIAGVGPNANGVSGTAPPGSTTPEDGFMGMDTAVNDLGPGQSTTVTIFYTYGQNTPVPEPMSLMLLAMGGALCLRRSRR